MPSIVVEWEWGTVLIIGRAFQGQGSALFIFSKSTVCKKREMINFLTFRKEPAKLTGRTEMLMMGSPPHQLPPSTPVGRDSWYQ